MLIIINIITLYPRRGFSLVRRRASVTRHGMTPTHRAPFVCMQFFWGPASRPVGPFRVPEFVVWSVDPLF